MTAAVGGEECKISKSASQRGKLKLCRKRTDEEKEDEWVKMVKGQNKREFQRWRQEKDGQIG